MVRLAAQEAVSRAAAAPSAAPANPVRTTVRASRAPAPAAAPDPVPATMPMPLESPVAAAAPEPVANALPPAAPSGNDAPIVAVPATDTAGRTADPAPPAIDSVNGVPAATAVAATASPAEAGTPSQDEILALIRERLVRSLAYPEAARRRGLSGDLVLGLNLSPKGRIARVSLLTSSGNPFLDRAVVRALTDDGPYPYLPGTIRVPVSLRLSRS